MSGFEEIVDRGIILRDPDFHDGAQSSSAAGIAIVSASHSAARNTANSLLEGQKEAVVRTEKE